MNTNDRPRYITQINAFHLFTEYCSLPPSAQLLWFKLMHLCNICGWPEWVGADTDRVMRWLGVKDKRAAYHARDALVKAGLLQFVSGRKGSPTQYRLLFFQEGIHTEYGTQTCTQTCTDMRIESVPKAVHIIREDIDKTRKDSKGVPAELADVWRNYAEMRKKMRKPLTDASSKLVLQKLASLAPDRLDVQKQILEQSVLNGWAGVFPLKKEEAPEVPASYDIEEIERKLLYGKIEYKKRS